VLLTLIGAQTVVAAFLYGLPSLGAAFRSSYDLSLGEVGILLAAPSAGLTLTFIAWGIIGDRHGERLALPLGLLGAGLGCVVAALADGAPVTIIGLLLAGGAGASMTLCARVAADVATPERRGEALSALMMALSLGGAIASLTFPLLESRIGISAPFWATAIAAAVVAIALRAVLPDTDHSAVRAPGASSVFRRWDVWRFSLAAGTAMLGGIALLAFMPVFLIDEHGWSAQGAAGLLAVTFLATAAARLALGRLSDRLRMRAVPSGLTEAATVALMLGLAVSARAPEAVVVTLLVVTIVVALSNNGTTATLVADAVGPALRGRGRRRRLRLAPRIRAGGGRAARLGRAPGGAGPRRAAPDGGAGPRLSRAQAWKLLPHPQEADAFGLLITNPAPWKLSS
jgi:predicted MFS family arabinose efflux permease